MGEVRSPYFSCGGDCLGNNAEIHSPYFSYGTRDYHGDSAEIHSSYFSVGEYYGEDAEIPSETFFHEDNNVENPYNAELDIVQNTYNTGKLTQPKIDEEWRIEFPAAIAIRQEGSINDGKCIYRVSDALRKSKGDIYTPRQISIGPIHHGGENLQSMKKQKKMYFDALCNRVVEKTKEEDGKFVNELWNTIKENEESIHRCYEEGAHEVKENKFLTVVLIDAVFIFEYLLRNEEINTFEDEGHGDVKKYEDDFILSEMRFWIRWDLMLLENQLPFFILEKLYDHLPEDVKGNYTSFRDLACAYFNRHIRSNYKPGDNKILHFTDLVRSLLSFKHPDLTVREPIEKFYSATQLHEAAIKMKDSRNECLLDIGFTSPKGELSIPRLVINSHTKCIFGNLMALEQRHYRGHEYICHYLKLFDYLITEPKDADLLIKNKIIDTKKDGVEVKILIDKLSEGAPEDFSCYYNLYTRLDQHYQKTWSKNIALYFRETYFGDVWKGTATVIATILLLLTFVQAICSVLQVS